MSYSCHIIFPVTLEIKHLTISYNLYTYRCLFVGACFNQLLISDTLEEESLVWETRMLVYLFLFYHSGAVSASYNNSVGLSLHIFKTDILS